MPYLLRRRKLGNGSCRGISQFSQRGIVTVRNDTVLPANANDLVFRWGCTSDVPQRNVVNTSRAIHAVANKKEFRRVLNDRELCPATYFSVEETPAQAYPVVVRPAQHHQGRHLHLCRTVAECRSATARYGDFYISKFIPKIAEYRVFVVSGRAVAVARKTPADATAVAWNVAQGGRFDNVRWDDWPLKAVKVSLEAFALSGLDFGGVDIMVDNEGDCTVLEINAAPSLTSEYRQQCFAKAFDYIVDHGKEIIPLVQERGGYLKFIHPALNERARV